MDAELGTLASMAAATAVTLATTDAWDQTKQKLLALWRRFRPDQADAVLAEFDQGHLEIQTADATITRAITLDWESRLLRLLATDASAAAELSHVVTELKALSVAAQVRGNISQEARAAHGTVIQVAGDLYGGVRTSASDQRGAKGKKRERPPLAPAGWPGAEEIPDDALADMDGDAASVQLMRIGPRRSAAVLAQLTPRRAAGLLSSMRRLPSSYAVNILAELSAGQAAAVLVELQEKFAAELLTEMGSRQASEILGEIPPRRVAALLAGVHDNGHADWLERMLDEMSPDRVVSVVAELCILIHNDSYLAEILNHISQDNAALVLNSDKLDIQKKCNILYWGRPRDVGLPQAEMPVMARLEPQLRSRLEEMLRRRSVQVLGIPPSPAALNFRDLWSLSGDSTGRSLWCM